MNNDTEIVNQDVVRNAQNDRLKAYAEKMAQLKEAEQKGKGNNDVK